MKYNLYLTSNRDVDKLNYTFEYDGNICIGENVIGFTITSKGYRIQDKKVSEIDLFSFDYYRNDNQVLDPDKI